MKKLKKRTLILILVILFLVAIGLIVGCSYTTGAGNVFFLIFIFIDFILLTYTVQVLAYKTAEVKFKNKYPKKSFKSDIDIYERLKALNYKERKTNYGYSFLKISNKQAIKVTIVLDNNEYYNQQPSQDNSVNKDLDNCKSFIGVEFFYNPDEDVLNKIADYSLQGGKIFYTAFAKQDNIYKSFNYIKPLPLFEEGFNNLLKELELEEVIEVGDKNGKHSKED